VMSVPATRAAYSGRGNIGALLCAWVIPHPDVCRSGFSFGGFGERH
jgi:hypothetical protein